MNKDFLIGCICIALSVTIFSTMEVFLKLPAVGAFDPMQLTLERAFVGGLLLLPVSQYFLKKHNVKLTAKDYGYFVFSGFLTVVLFMALFQLAVTFGQANVVAVIFSGNPIFVTVLAAVILHEVIRWNNVLALVFDLLGILIIVDPFGSSDLNPVSLVMVLLAALFFSLYTVLSKRKTARMSSIVVTCFSFLFGSVELFAILLLGHTGPGAALYEKVGLDILCGVPFLQGFSRETLPYFLFICLVYCAIGYVFHMMAIEKTSATLGSLVFFFKPILAPIVALVVLGEPITPTIAAGIAMFLIGSLLSIIPNIIRTRKAKQALLARKTT
ncbi:MAG: DMT family transporter [Ruminiclostridium sp.]|nr:DMT family transporter [Ruminiclostridium sp.]